LLVLWNIDLTLVDVVRVTRAAYAEAFAAVTGRPLVQLPLMAGQTESEIFFEALALNPPPDGSADDGDEVLLERFCQRLAAAFRARRERLSTDGQLLPGAREAVTAVGRLPGVVQTVLTGSIRPNALEKLRAFGLDPLLDASIGGYGSDPYPKGTMLLNSRGLAAHAYGGVFTDESTVYVADSTRDVEAAAIGGARIVAVASGRSTVSDLRDAGAGVVLEDLTDTPAVTAAVAPLTATARS